MPIIRNDSDARRNLAFGPYRLALAPGASVACDLPEFIDHLRGVVGITITDSPSGNRSPEPGADHPASPPTKTRKRKPATIVVAE